MELAELGVRVALSLTAVSELSMRVDEVIDPEILES